MHIELTDVALNKAAIIERCIRRIKEEYSANPALNNYTNVDALTLNVERACQACIDLAMHISAKEQLGVPQSSGEAFTLLRQAGIIDQKIEKTLWKMVGFRNIAIHQYQKMNVEALRHIAEEGWKDLETFCKKLGLRINTMDQS